MKSQPSLAWFATLLIPLVGIGCDSPTDPQVREFTVTVDSMTVPEVVGSTDSIPVRVFGWFPTDCFAVSHFREEKTDSQVDLRLRATEPRGLVCPARVKYFEETYVVHPPFTDPFLVVFHQKGKSTL